MTNILDLPQLAGTLDAVNNADLRASIQFIQNGSTSPLDLTGISFACQIRPSADRLIVSVDMTTENGLMINGGTNGILSWFVPKSAMKNIKPGAYVADVLAVADGAVVNLFQTAPLVVTIAGGLTC